MSSNFAQWHLISVSFVILSYIADCVWQIADKTLPREDCAMAIGEYNDTIYIFGGVQYNKQFVIFSPDIGTFTDIGKSILVGYGLDGQHDGQYYTQIANTSTFYMLRTIEGDGTEQTSRICYYNMEWNTSSPEWKHCGNTSLNLEHDPYVPPYVPQYSCLASSVDHLFVIGGSLQCTINESCNSNTVQTLNLNTLTWTMTYMNKNRWSLSCIVDPNNQYVYAIGGQKNQILGNTLSSIERYKFNENGTWQYFPDSCLTTAAAETRSVLWQNYIFIVGGRDKYNIILDTIHVIDTNEDTCNLLLHRLPYAVTRTTVVTFNDVLYVFGGIRQHYSNGIWGVNTFMFLPLYPTIHPTLTPTLEPTLVPTIYPTIEPTLFPTLYPTTEPTLIPTSAPSNSPTVVPTTSPSNNPSLLPTAQTVTPTSLPHDLITSNKAQKINILSIIGLCFAVIFAVVVTYVIIKKCQTKNRKKLEIPGINNSVLLQLQERAGARINVIEQTSDENNIEECKVRLMNTMKEYESKHQNEGYIDSIDIESVLNDFHIWLNHCGKNKEMAICDSLACKVTDCIVFTRHYRDRFNINDNDLALYTSIKQVDSAQYYAKEQI
eukprot:369551_1